MAADWELPPGLLQRQSHRELQRAVLELQRSGFSEDEIQAHENSCGRTAGVDTARALKEHFILERIAEDEEIDADEEDYDAEIRLIAAQSNESPRRVRARLEKGGIDGRAPQPDHRAEGDRPDPGERPVQEVPYEPEESDVEALDLSAGGSESPRSRRPSRRRHTAGPARNAPHGGKRRRTAASPAWESGRRRRGNAPDDHSVTPHNRFPGQ